MSVNHVTSNVFRFWKLWPTAFRFWFTKCILSLFFRQSVFNYELNSQQRSEKAKKLNKQLTLTTLGVVGSNFSSQQRQHRRLIGGAEQEQRNSWRSWEMIFDLTNPAAIRSERVEPDKETVLVKLIAKKKKKALYTKIVFVWGPYPPLSF